MSEDKEKQCSICDEMTLFMFVDWHDQGLCVCLDCAKFCFKKLKELRNKIDV